MRSLLLVLGVALAVILVAEGMASVGGSRAGSLEIESMNAGPVRPAAAPTAATAPPPAPPAAGGVLAPPDVGILDVHLRSRGPVGAALKRLLAKTVGQPHTQLDRSFAQDYFEVLEAWRKDPSRFEEDLKLVLRMWEEVRDPGFRWAMSWMFQAVPDDRLVEPLTELLSVDAWRMVDAIAGIGTEKAAARLAAISGVIEKVEARCQATARVARSEWEGAVPFLRGSIEDPRTSDLERLNAVECLGLVQKDPRGLELALDIALGPAVPLGDIGARRLDHDFADLRSGAVLAVMRQGDLQSLRRLWDRADVEGGDPALVSMVDRHLVGFQGSDASRLVLDRIQRRGRVSKGEALYLAGTAQEADAAALEALAASHPDAEVARLLRLAAERARTR
jgi:hypothetical protein